MSSVIVLPLKVPIVATKAGVSTAKLTGRTVRRVGPRRLVLLAAGVGIGLLVAPRSGSELRRRIRTTLGELGGAPPVDLADRVRDELASSPRTWHLPQPAVAIEAGRVVLTGEVPHATAAADLERTAMTIKGVIDVDNRLTIARP